jgi:8-oxo-dGTP diphosphatase
LERKLQEIPTFVPVVAAALIDDSDRVLLQQRRVGRVHAGLWEFPGGKVEAGESLDQALLREITEELGIALDPSALEPLSFAAMPGERHVVLLYICRVWLGEPGCLDAAALGWFNAAELASLPLLPLDVPLARVVRAQLESGN